MLVKLTKSTNDTSSTNTIRSQASPVLHMLHHFALWQKRVNGSLLDSLIRDRIFVGIRDNGTRK